MWPESSKIGMASSKRGPISAKCDRCRTRLDRLRPSSTRYWSMFGAGFDVGQSWPDPPIVGGDPIGGAGAGPQAEPLRYRIRGQRPVGALDKPTRVEGPGHKGHLQKSPQRRSAALPRAIDARPEPPGVDRAHAVLRREASAAEAKPTRRSRLQRPHRPGGRAARIGGGEMNTDRLGRCLVEAAPGSRAERAANINRAKKLRNVAPYTLLGELLLRP